MPGIFKVNSNAKAFLAARKAAKKKVASKVRKALLRGGREYIRALQRKYMTGRPGLNRVTGFLVRGWFHTVVRRTRIDKMKLLVWTPVEYAKYHTDTSLRKKTMPARLLVQKEWHAFTREGGRFDELIIKELAQL